MITKCYGYSLKTYFLSSGIYFKLKIELSQDYKFWYMSKIRNHCSYKVRFNISLSLSYSPPPTSLPSSLIFYHIFPSCPRFSFNRGSNASSTQVRLHNPPPHIFIWDIIVCIPKKNSTYLYTVRENISHVRCLFRSSSNTK